MDAVAERERDKYRRAWQTDAYQRHSPGLLAAPVALEWVRTMGARSLTDYGCGDGRALRWFNGRNLRTLGVDLMGDEAGALGAVAAPLWALPDTLPATDFAFSADTLEHIPPDRVCASLEAIAQKARLGGFFQIATRPDVVGPRDLGEPLHLTVETGEWWLERLSAVFDVTRWSDDGGVARYWFRAYRAMEAAA